MALDQSTESRRPSAGWGPVRPQSFQFKLVQIPVRYCPGLDSSLRWNDERHAVAPAQAEAQSHPVLKTAVDWMARYGQPLPACAGMTNYEGRKSGEDSHVPESCSTIA